MTAVGASSRPVPHRIRALSFPPAAVHHGPSPNA